MKRDKNVLVKQLKVKNSIAITTLFTLQVGEFC